MSIPIIMSMHAGVQDTGEASPNLLKPSQGFGRLQKVGWGGAKLHMLRPKPEGRAAQKGKGINQEKA